MKHLALIVIFLSCFSVAHATHLAGGNISVRDLGYNNYEITINISRDTSAGSSQLNQIKYTFFKTDLTYSFNRFISFQLIPSAPLNGHPQNVELYQAKDTVNFLTAGDYKVFIQQCCSPGPFNNASINRAFYLECAFRVFPYTIQNSSPVILNPSINVVPVNQSFTYNINAYDEDGDKWRIYSIHPLEADSTPIPFYATPSSDSANVFHIDSLSGDVTWTPNQIGRFLVSFEIQEFRNRILIGRTIRNQTIIVVPDSNHLPIINNFSAIPVDAYGYKCVQLTPNQNYSLTLFAHDLDLDSINMIAYGETLLLQSNPAFFSVSPLGANQIQGVFSWAPDSSAVRIEKYHVTFRIQDAHYARDYSLFVKVGNLFPGMQDASNVISDLILFPVPAQNNLTIKFDLKTQQTLSFKIIDSGGKLMLERNNKNYASGTHKLDLPIQLPNGIYYLETSNSSMLLKTNPLLVITK